MLRRSSVRYLDVSRPTPFPKKWMATKSWMAAGSMIGGAPRIYYGWMKPGSTTRRRFEKHRNPFVDLDTGASIYYRDTRDSVQAMRTEADAQGITGTDNAIDLYNQYKIVPDLYPEGFQWKHKLNTEYNQWRSNTWATPELIPTQHRGRFLCNFYLNIGKYDIRTAKFSPHDHRQWMFCLVYVGTGKGIAGYGKAVAPSTQEAKREAIKNAFDNIIAIDLEDAGPVYTVRMNVDGSRVTLYPSTRLVGNIRSCDILLAFGIQHAGVKINIQRFNNPKGPEKAYGSIFGAVAAMKSANEIAHARGKVPASLFSNIYPWLEETRRRKGMMAMHPGTKDGHFVPDRTVDNRMPDHLKKGYYDDHHWKDFFAGSKQHLMEPKIGLRSDELRDAVPANLALTAGGGGAEGRVGQRLLGSASGSPRRTLADVLNRMGRTAHSLGSSPVSNPFADEKLTTHAKMHFHLH